MKDGKLRSTSKTAYESKDGAGLIGKKRALTTDDLMRMAEDAQEGRARKRARVPLDEEDEEEAESDDESEGQSESESDEEDAEETSDARTLNNSDESDGEPTPLVPPPSRIQTQDRFSSSLLAKQQRLPHRSKATLEALRSNQDEMPPAPSRPPASFASYNIAPQLLTALRAMSIKTPTEVQAACIPPLLAGRDCIGNAKTGSGKTVAFALPILQRLSMDPYGLFALVLTPTRELAFQIAEQFAVLGAPLNIRTAVIVGGMDMIAQAIELNNRPHVIVATPGRLVDHLRSKTGEWDLGRVKFLVLDEADRLLTETFADELGYLFDKVPKERQTCLFTATWTEAVERVANGPVRPGKEKPFVHRMTDIIETVATLEQYYLLVPSHVREVYLYYLLCHPPESILHLRRAPPEDPKKKKKKKTREEEEAPEQPPPTIIFCRKTKTAAYVTQLLQSLQIRSTALHSGLTQRERLNSLSLFRAHVVPVLVSTDVGARGLDIEDVGMVVNWDMPNEAEEYTHRVGRTGRAGKGGVAVSFVTEFDEERVLAVENRINTKLTEMSMKEELVLEELKKLLFRLRTSMEWSMTSEDRQQIPTPPLSAQGSPQVEQEGNNTLVSVSTTFYPGADLLSTNPDTILLSSDNVFFYVNRPLLLAASENNFASKLSTAIKLQIKAEDQEIIAISDDSTTLNIILHAVYNISCAHYAPSFPQLSAAIRRFPIYGLQVSTYVANSSPLYNLLLSHAPLCPIELYALAASFDLYELAVATSSHLLSFPLSTITDEIASSIGPIYLKRLFFLHFGRADALKRVLLPPPHPHAPTSSCDFMEQKKLTRAWALASAYLAWDARPDLSTSAMESALRPLSDHLSCQDCKRGLNDRIKNLVVQWSIVKRTI